MLKFAIPALAVLSLAAPATAKEIDDRSVTVTFADLDLASDAGLATLQGRVQAAVKEVCARPSIRDLAAVATWRKCRADALDQAARQIAETHAAVQRVADSR